MQTSKCQRSQSTGNITSLKVSASITSQYEIIKVYENHFTQKKASFEIFLDQLNERKTETTDDSNDIITHEVVKAINKLNAESSPGLDGITSNFRKMFKREMAT